MFYYTLTVHDSSEKGPKLSTRYRSFFEAQLVGRRTSGTNYATIIEWLDKGLAQGELAREWFWDCEKWAPQKTGAFYMGRKIIAGGQLVDVVRLSNGREIEFDPKISHGWS